MRINKLFLLIITLSFWVSCTESRYKSHLDAIEMLVQEDPVSALDSLRSLSGEYNHMNSEDKAQYSLLLAMALDKSYIDTTATSILDDAVTYYSKKGSSRKKMLTYYYLGRIQGNAQRYTESLLSLSLSLEQGDDDPSYRGRTFLAMADAYNATYNIGEETACMDSAMFYFHLSDNLQLIRGATYRKAVNLINLGDYSRALELLNELQAVPDLERHLRRNCLLQSAHVIALLDDSSHYEDALNQYSEVLETGLVLDEKHAGSYAYLLYMNGHNDSGLAVFNTLDSLGSSARAVSDSWRSLICFHEGEYERAYHYQEEALSYQDSVIVASLNQSLVAAQRDYYAEKAERSKQQAELMKSRQTILVLFTVLFVLLMIIGYWLIRKRSIRKVSEYESMLEELKAELFRQTEAGCVANQETSNLREQFKRVYKHHFDLLAQFYEEYDIQRRNRIPEEQRNSLIHQIIDGLRGETNTDNRFEKIVDEDMNGIISQFRKDFPDFSEIDYRLFSYYVAGFTTKTISIIVQGLSADALYMRKSRIKKSIEKSETPMRFHYLEYL